MAGASSFGGYANQAAREALLRFGPQRSNLAELIREAQQNYGGRVRAARTGAAGTLGAIHNALPRVQQIYSGADSASKAGATLLSQALQGAPADSPVRQGAANENAVALQNLINQKSAAEGRLTQEGVAAREGQQFAQNTAQSILAKELRSLLQKRSNIAGEEGLFTTTTADKLAKEAAKEEGAERRAERTDRTSRENNQETNRTRRETAADKTPKGGVKQQSSKDQAAAATRVREMEGLARSLAAHGLSRHAIEETLTAEEPSISRKNAKGEDEHVGGRKAYAKDVLLRAALDSAIGGFEGQPHGYGNVSQATLRELHAEGYSLNALSLSGARAPRTELHGVSGGVQAGGRRRR